VTAVDPELHPDYWLVARMAAGEAAALDELRQRHERTTYALAFAILMDPVGAAHAVSEAFLEAFRLATGFAPGEVTVLAWLTRLTRQRAEAIAAHRR
jgi:DNA-directed RNA polymerase specialized sigma24 family protein